MHFTADSVFIVSDECFFFNVFAGHKIQGFVVVYLIELRIIYFFYFGSIIF